MVEATTDDYLAIQNVVHSFFRLVDDGRAAEAAKFFTGDARIVYGPGTLNPGMVEGDGILEALKIRQAQTHVTTRHVSSNLSLTFIGEHEVQARSLLTLFRSETPRWPPAVYALVDVTDSLARVDGRWLFRERRIFPIFADALVAAPQTAAPLADVDTCRSG